MDLLQVDRITEDRKRQAELRAALLVKRELVARSIEAFVADYRERRSPESEATLVDQFVQGLEKRS